MKRTVVHSMMFASIAAGLVGCQSGPHWTWWKPWENSSKETAVAASSAAPALPSSSATPQAIAASGLQPAASPSATNLAGTGSALAASPLGVQPASPSTITNAPLATYPTTGAPPISDIPPSSVASTTPAAAGSISPLSTTPTTSSLAATRPATTLASVPAAGPYDPNGYQPSASLAASTAERHHRFNCRSLRQLCDCRGGPIHPACFHTCDDPDRECFAGRSLCDVLRQCGPGRRHNDARRSLFEYCSRVDRRHQCAGRSDCERSLRPMTNSAAVSPPATGFASHTTPGGPVANTAPASLSSTPTSNYVAEAMAAAPTTSTASATVPIKSPAGQYRPGGTSSYSGGTNENRIDVASRPGAPAVSPSSAPQSATPTSDPWTPQPTAPTSNAPTRTGGSVSVGAGGSVY